MKKIFLLTLLLAVTGFAQALTRYQLDVKEFSRLKVTSPIDVEYSSCADSAGMAVFYSERDMTSAIMFANSNGELEVSMAPDQVITGSIPRLKLYSTFLTRVENRADSTVRVDRLLPGAEFTAVLSGNGKLVVHDIDVTRAQGELKTGHGTLVMQGKCRQEQIKFMGAGTIEAAQLEAVETSIGASGTGQVSVWATDYLKIKGMGSTTIYYRGTPKIKKSFCVGLKLRELK